MSTLDSSSSPVSGKSDRSATVWILTAAGGIVVALAVVIIATRPGESPSGAAALTPEARAYLEHLSVTEARMSAARNMAGDTVTYLDAQIANQGDRLVRRVELQLEFNDALNQVVLREKAFPVTLRSAPLKPGERRPFQVAFEHMPADWNRAPPAITAVNVQF